MISIVVTTYNGERYIEKQLDSLRQQTVQADEVIIVDDCSTDNTFKLVEKYIYFYGLNWTLLSNKYNQGYKKNFYNAISMASGDLIFLCDQDDEWHKDKIETMMKKFNTNTQILALSCAVKLIDKDSIPIRIKKEKNRYNSNFLYNKASINKLTYFDLEYILKHNISPGCTMAFKSCLKDCFEKIYDYNMPHDWFLNMIAATLNGCAFLNETLVDYRCHSNNAIGADTNLIKGIKDKTREFRVNDYQARISSAKNIMNYYNISSKIDFSLLLKVIDFYKKPSPLKLIKLYQTDGYLELSRRKVRLWEVIVSFNFDQWIRKFLK